MFIQIRCQSASNIYNTYRKNSSSVRGETAQGPRLSTSVVTTLWFHHQNCMHPLIIRQCLLPLVIMFKVFTNIFVRYHRLYCNASSLFI